MSPKESEADGNQDRFLLRLNLRIAGTQYYEAQYKPGEQVFFNREPANKYDERAIGIQNEDFQKVGYIPREEAYWIAPLLDAGQIRLTARIAFPERVLNPDSELEISLYLTARGEALLAPFPTPVTEEQALHNLLLEAWKQSEEAGLPKVAKGLARRLKPLLNRASLPQSQLALRLIAKAGQEAARKRAEASALITSEWLRELETGQPVSARGLSLFPLFAKHQASQDYLLLEQALELGALELREVSESGSVPELLVVNKGDLAVLLPEGQVVMGGRQNRVINLSVIVEARTEYRLPVSCVEQGRWSSAKEAFRAASFAPTELRARKTASANKNLRERGIAESDQGQVWADVRACLAASDIASPTGDLSASFEPRTSSISELYEQLPLADGAVGFFFALGDNLLGGEVFDNPKTLRALWPRLSETYFIRALLAGEVEGETSSETISAFLALLSDGVTAPLPGEDTFDRPELALAGFVGSALVWRGAVRQLAVLELDETFGFPFEG